MTSTSHDILEYFRVNYAKNIDLSLRPAYRDLLQKLGDPHLHLPPVFHVAGTNGKGSTCAFLRSILEAAGKTVHVYTSPHLVRFHERIRVAGQLISDEFLTAILEECRTKAEPHGVSFFEAATAAAFAAFARTPADYTILEVGLGGCLDATNVVPNPIATLITRLSYDHREFLGDTIAKIAFEKAGIMKRGVPCFTAAQAEPEATTTLIDAAQKVGAHLFMNGRDWNVTPTAHGFTYQDHQRRMDLPAPALDGIHQYGNAGLAIAALSALPEPNTPDVIAQGLRKVQWPARMQHLTHGKLATMMPDGWELWLDGGHNDSAGEVIAAHIQNWRNTDNRPLYIVTAMLTSKHPAEFLTPFAAYAMRTETLAIPGEPLSMTAEQLAEHAHSIGMAHVHPASDLESALRAITTDSIPGRILICGSLYLAGHVLALNDAHMPV